MSSYTPNMRRHNTDPSVRRSGSTRSRTSDESYESQSTAPSSYYSPRPSLQHAAASATGRSRRATPEEDLYPATSIHERASTESYASTIPEELYEEPESIEDLTYAVPSYGTSIEAQPRASTPHDFADYFPSQRRLCIRHDDTTSDGNMNLRVDTEISESGHRFPLTLFHLRMQDLKARQFSLRRYCRDSGREVCHSARKYQKPASERPGIQRSVSNALAGLRITRPDGPKRTNSWGSAKSSKSTKSVPVRQDSGYGSDDEDNEGDDDVESFMSSSTQHSRQSSTSVPPLPTNTTKLDFSNYAQVNLSRRGGSTSKRYEFEYWGHSYTWKRSITKDGAGKRISYHLVATGEKGGSIIAHIVPDVRSSAQLRQEEEAGGWVPTCSFWIEDGEGVCVGRGGDVADVIVATGLIALVDDCIKRRFNPKKKSKMSSSSSSSFSSSRIVNLPGTGHSIEYVGPKALYDALRRRGSTERERERERDLHAHRESPLRRQVGAY